MKIKFMAGYLDSNQHIYPGFGVIRGPKIKYCKLLSVHAPSTGHRLWFYAPSGACWNLDIYIDRREEVKEYVRS